MSENMVNNWIDKFPFGFENVILALSNKTKIAIVAILLENEEMLLSDIRRELSIPKEIAHKYLNEMVNEDLIIRIHINFNEHEKIFNSKYALNSTYKCIIQTMKNALRQALKTQSKTI